MSKKVTLQLTVNEFYAIRAMVQNGWGDGDFRGYGGLHVPTQHRAIQKIEDMHHILWRKRNHK